MRTYPWEEEQKVVSLDEYYENELHKEGKKTQRKERSKAVEKALKYVKFGVNYDGQKTNNN